MLVIVVVHVMACLAARGVASSSSGTPIELDVQALEGGHDINSIPTKTTEHDENVLYESSNDRPLFRTQSYLQYREKKKPKVELACPNGGLVASISCLRDGRPSTPITSDFFSQTVKDGAAFCYFPEEEEEGDGRIKTISAIDITCINNAVGGNMNQQHRITYFELSSDSLRHDTITHDCDGGVGDGLPVSVQCYRGASHYTSRPFIDAETHVAKCKFTDEGSAVAQDEFVAVLEERSESHRMKVACLEEIEAFPHPSRGFGSKYTTYTTEATGKALILRSSCPGNGLATHVVCHPCGEGSPYPKIQDALASCLYHEDEKCSKQATKKMTVTCLTATLP